MAVDEALAAAVAAGESPPTLRFYRWQRATLSLGYLQSAAAGIDLPGCVARGIPLVRRPTGGRAVLHDQELTYSLVLPRTAWWRSQPLPECFRAISAGLLAGLQHLGVPAALGDGAASPGAAPAPRGACFPIRHMPAIVVGGRKLAGSAGRCWEHALLQHGSLLLGFDAALQGAVFPDWPAPARQVVWLSALLDAVPPPDALAAALARGWEDVLGTRCLPGDLTPAEERRAAALVAERYARPCWTLRR
jgi:lipoate-protein ligase A